MGGSKMNHLSISISKNTPLMLRTAEPIPETKVHATARHDSSTATVRSHMTIVTTGGMQPEMRDQETDTYPDA